MDSADRGRNWIYLFVLGFGIIYESRPVYQVLGRPESQLGVYPIFDGFLRDSIVAVDYLDGRKGQQ